MNVINAWGPPLNHILVILATLAALLFVFGALPAPPVRAAQLHAILERRIGPLVAFLSLLALLLCYLRSDGFIDYSGETSQVCQSAVLKNAQPIYRNVLSGEDHSSPYGPNVFLFYYWAAVVSGDPISGSKLAAAGVLLLALFICYLAINRIGREVGPAFLYLLILLGIAGPAAYWARLEPLLLLFVACLAWAKQLGGMFGSFAAGAALALGINVKIIFPVYSPALMLLPSTKRFSFWIAAVGFVIFLILPWFRSEFSFPLYLTTISSQGNSRYFLYTWSCAFLLSIFLLFPLLTAAYRSRSNAVSRGEWIVSIASLGIVLVLSGKEGAGTYYLLPFAPIWALQFAKLSSSLSGPVTPKAWLMAASLGWVLVIGEHAPSMFFGPIRAARFDLEQILGCIQNRSLRFGQSDLWGFQFNSVRADVCQSQGRNDLDPSMLFEQRRVQPNLSPDQEQPFRDSSIAVVLVPGSGVPFAMPSGYDLQDRAFGKGFTHLFTGHYCRVARQGVFQIWMPKAMAQAEQERIGGCIQDEPANFQFRRLDYRDRYNSRRRLRWQCRWSEKPWQILPRGRRRLRAN